MKKIPIQIHLDAPLVQWLRIEAARRGISLGEMVRIAIRRMMESGGA